MPAAPSQAQVAERGEPAPVGHGDHRVRALLVGFRAPDGDPQPLRLPGEVGDIERHELRAEGGERHAEGDQRAVASGGEAVAGNGAEQLHDDVGVDGALGVGRVRARAADADEHLGHDRAGLGPVRGDQAGALVRMGGARPRAARADKWSATSAGGAGRAAPSRARHHSVKRRQSAS